MANSQGPGSRGTDHQHVILKSNVRPDRTTDAAFTRPAGPDHQHVILRCKVQSDRATGPDHQQVVLRRREGSVPTVYMTQPIKHTPKPSPGTNHQNVDILKIDAQGTFTPAPENPTTSEPVDDPSGRPQPAEVYIFNHEDFGSVEKNRRGSSEDVEALRKTFEKLQCEVYEIQNPNLSEVKREIRKLAAKKFVHQSALVVVILSHGARNENILTCDHKLYNLDDDVLFPLFQNKTLRGKPKILIVQACKGTMEADASPSDGDPRGYMKCYSSTEGFKSYRDTLEGSIYIQTLCKVMDQEALTKDFRRIVEDVNAKVAEESIQQSEGIGRNYKQVPATTNTLYRPYCFGDYVQDTT